MTTRDLRSLSVSGFAVFGLLALAAWYWPEGFGRVACVACGLISGLNWVAAAWLMTGTESEEPTP